MRLNMASPFRKREASSGRFLMIHCCVEQLDQPVFLPVVGGWAIVVPRELDETGVHTAGSSLLPGVNQAESGQLHGL